MKKILMPLGLGDTTEAVLEQGAMMARAFASEIRLLHIFKVPGLVAERKLPQEVLEEKEKELHEVRRDLDALAERLRGQGIRAEAEVVESADAVDTIILQAGDYEADLIVMGAHGRSAIVGALLGDVAQDVLRKAPCPVLIVPMAMLTAKERAGGSEPVGREGAGDEGGA